MKLPFDLSGLFTEKSEDQSVALTDQELATITGGYRGGCYDYDDDCNDYCNDYCDDDYGYGRHGCHHGGHRGRHHGGNRGRHYGGNCGC